MPLDRSQASTSARRKPLAAVAPPAPPLASRLAPPSTSEFAEPAEPNVPTEPMEPRIPGPTRFSWRLPHSASATRCGMSGKRYSFETSCSSWAL